MTGSARRPPGRIHGPAASHSASSSARRLGVVVDEQGGAGLRADGHLDRLLGGQMAALGVVVGGVAQRRLDEQQVRAAGERRPSSSLGPVSPVYTSRVPSGASTMTPQAGT